MNLEIKNITAKAQRSAKGHKEIQEPKLEENHCFAALCASSRLCGKGFL